MTHDTAAVVFAGACPWLALTLCLQSAAGRRGARLSGLALLCASGTAALALLMAPIGGTVIARWVAGLNANFSIPLTGLLVAAVWKRAFATPILSSAEWRTAWLFGALGGLALYPFALGVGSLDPYEWGWRFGPLFVVIAALTVWLIWKQNRFGILLMLAVAAFHLRLLESTNYWDYLLDPVFWVVSLVVIGRRSITRLRGGRQPAAAR
jgi:MFS family permease